MNAVNSTSRKGALSAQVITDMVDAGFITGTENGNIKPSSLDLCISDEVYEVSEIFQPNPGESVRDLLGYIGKKPFDLKTPMQKDRMYLARLKETFKLPQSVYAYSNPKSTTGRNDIHVRLIADGVSRYDTVPENFTGELWVSIMPKSFAVKVAQGQSLNQLRLFNADTRLDDLELHIAMEKHRLLWQMDKGQYITPEDVQIKDNDSSIILRLDIESSVPGYVGRETDDVLDLNDIGLHEPKNFFEPVDKDGGYVRLEKGRFYILSTLEGVRVPPELACEMVPMDEKSGEFRAHYAGFIDPGWGWGKEGEGSGRPLTLEVRPFEDIIVRHKQPIAKIRFERLSSPAESVYDAISSNYLSQSGPRLSKHFREWN